MQVQVSTRKYFNWNLIFRLKFRMYFKAGISTGILIVWVFVCLVFVCANIWAAFGTSVVCILALVHAVWAAHTTPASTNSIKRNENWLNWTVTQIEQKKSGIWMTSDDRSFTYPNKHRSNAIKWVFVLDTISTWVVTCCLHDGQVIEADVGPTGGFWWCMIVWTTGKFGKSSYICH